MAEIDKIEIESKSIQELFRHSVEFKNLVGDPTHKKNEQMNVIKKLFILLDIILIENHICQYYNI